MKAPVLSRDNADGPAQATLPERAALLDGQRRVLDRLASGAPLEDVLQTLVDLIEEHSQMRCAVLLADLSQKRLRFVAARSIPEDYRTNMKPYLAIAPNSGSCGMAAYLKQRVYTRDTATDENWRRFGDIAVRNGLRAVWSTPILGDDMRVLGTFAMYYSEPQLPNDEDRHLIDMAVQLARVAIEARRDDELLRVTFDDALRPLVVTDMDSYIVRANHAFAQLVGYTAAELHGMQVTDVADCADNSELRASLLNARQPIARDVRLRTRSGKLRWARCLASLRRDKSGAPRYIVNYVQRASETPASPLDELSQRERQVLELVVSGKKSKDIARQLGIAPATVDTYRSRLMLKLGIEDLAGLVRFALEHGIVRE